MPKISELPVLAEAAADDIVALVDTSGSVTNKVTRSGLVTGGFPLIATAGTAAAFTLALPTSLTNAAGQTFRVRFHLAPDAGATIAIDGQTALALRLYDGAGALTALAAGDVAIDSVVTLTLIDDGGTLRAVVNRDRFDNLIAPSGTVYSQNSGTLKGFLVWDSGPATDKNSVNITSLTDNGTGDTSITFTNAMSDGDYGAVFMVGNPGSLSTDIGAGRTADSSSSIRILQGNENNTYVDRTKSTVSLVGDLA